MTRGEALGILWSDIDFEKRILTISITMNDRPDGEGKCRKRIQSTKTTAGNRDIPLVSEVIDAFLTEYEIQKSLGVCEEEIDGLSGFVFSNSEHNVYTEGAVNRALHQITDDYNELEVIRAKAGGEDNNLSSRLFLQIITIFCRSDVIIVIVRRYKY